MSVEIERIYDVDAGWEEIEPLLRALHEFHLPLTGVPLLPDWAAIQREHITAMPEGIVLIAREHGRAVGLANGWVSRSPAIFEEEYARLDSMYVVDELRGSGIGRQLLDAFEAWASEQGVQEVRLGVVASNEVGRRFWSAAGFEAASIAMKKQIGAG